MPAATHRQADPQAAILSGVAAQLRVPERLAFLDFFRRYVWPIVEPGTIYEEGEAQQLLAEWFEEIADGRVRRFQENLPPRELKSVFTTVAFPTWVWTFKPQTRFILTSYSGDLATFHSIKRREIIESEAYQRDFPNVRISTDQNKKNEYNNTHGGHMIAVGMGGTVGGKGADIIIADDLLNPNKGPYSGAHRNEGWRFLTGTLTNRLNDKKTGVIIVVEQRLHPRDISGRIGELEHKNGKKIYDKVILQAIATKDTTVKFPRSGRKWKIKKDGVLNESRAPLSVIEWQRDNDMTPFEFEGRCQQQPRSPKGTIFERGWFDVRYKELPDHDFSFWMWDTAVKTGEENAYTVGWLFFVSGVHLYVAHEVRGRYKYPTMKQIIRDSWLAQKTDVVLIEDKSSGQQAIQDFEADGTLPVIAVDPKGDKVARAHRASGTAKAGRIHFPEAEWVKPALDEVCEFPHADFADRVDVLTGAVLYFREHHGEGEGLTTPNRSASDDAGLEGDDSEFTNAARGGEEGVGGLEN